MIEFLSGGRSSADTVVNMATVQFRIGAVALIERLVFNVAYIGPMVLNIAYEKMEMVITFIAFISYLIMIRYNNAKRL